MIELNISYKCRATEENLIKSSRFITFLHLRKLFVRNASSFPGEYIFCLHEMLFV